MTSTKTHTPISTINNRYVIKKSLGKGGMGEVFYVYDRLFNNRPLALKVISESLNSKKSAYSFKKEFDILSRLNHPNLVKVYDFSLDLSSQNHFITMDYVKGQSVSSFWHNKKQKTESDLLDIIVVISRTLDYIHSRNIIHRDITPNNIMMVEDVIKIMDFGIADTTVHSGLPKGTLSSMAPEVLSEKTSRAVDFFSFGCTLFTMITGTALYGQLPAQSIIHILRNKKSFENHVFSQLPLVNNELCQTIITKLLSYNPEDRFSTGAAIIEFCNKAQKKTYPIETEDTKDAYVSTTEFIGRKKQYHTLIGYVNKQKPQIQNPILVHGEPGIGKSRLFFELRKHCQLEGIPFFEGSCFNDNRSQFFPFATVLSSLLFVSDEGVLQKYGPDLKKIIPNHPRLNHIQQRYQHTDPKTEWKIQIRAISQCIVSHAVHSVQNIVVYLNDIQWIDEGSRDVIFAIMTLLKKEQHEIQRGHIVLLMSSRPEGLSFVPEMEKSFPIEKIELTAFSEESIEQFIHATFGEKKIDATLIQNIPLIHTKVGGNPFFIQEFFRYLIREQHLDKINTLWSLKKPISEIGIPSRIEDIIADRIGTINFSDNSLKMLQILSLIHRPMSNDELTFIQPLDDQAITLLLSRQLIACTTREDKTQYTLFHELLRSAILKTINKTQRLHEKIANGLESYYTDIPVCIVEDLANHFYEANNSEKARNYSEIALKNAGTTMNKESYLGFYEKLLTLYQSDDYDNRLRLKTDYAQFLSIIGKMELARSQLCEIIECAKKQQLGVHEAIAFRQHLYLQIQAASKESISEPHINRLLTTLDKEGYYTDLSQFYCILGFYYLKRKNDFQKSMEAHELGIAAGEKGKDPIAIARNIGNIAILQQKQGKLDKAMDLFSKVNKIFEDREEYTHLYAIGFQRIAEIHTIKREFSQALQCLEKKDAIMAKLQYPEYNLYSTEWRIIIYLEQGDFSKAAHYLTEGRKCLDVIEDESFQKDYIFLFMINQWMVDFGLGLTDNTIETMEKYESDLGDDELRKGHLYFELWRMTQSKQHQTRALQYYTSLAEHKRTFLMKSKIEQLQSSSVEFDIYHDRRSQGKKHRSEKEEESFNLADLVHDAPPHISVLYENIIKDSQTMVEQVMEDVEHTIRQKHTQQNRVLLQKIQAAIQDESANHSLTEKIQKHKEYQILLDTIRDLNSNLTIDSILMKVLDASLMFLHAERGCVILQDKNGSYAPHKIRNSNKEDIAVFSIPKVVDKKMKKEFQPIFIQDLIEDEAMVTSASIMEMELRSIMCAPLQYKSDQEHQFFGFLYLDSKSVTNRKGFTGDNLELLQLLANQAAVPIRNALLATEIKDVLEKKTQIEIEIRELNENLEEKVVSRTEELKVAQKTLVENAYRMGMADIASEVLHNVGNVLTSLMTSAHYLVEKLDHSHIPKLLKANRLLRDTMHTPESNGTLNPKGQKLVDFYLLLGEELQEEKDSLLYHSNRLEKNAKIMKDIISTQQRYAGVKSALEELDLVQAIDDALKILETSFNSHMVQLNKKYSQEETVPIVGITFKIIHILVNILKNAKESLETTARHERAITISIQKNEKTIELTIANNGEPIKPENSTKIFTHGFSTKKNGHGFGLHSSANYMKEMKGSIQASSDGKRGTAFILTFQKS